VAYSWKMKIGSREKRCKNWSKTWWRQWWWNDAKMCSWGWMDEESVKCLCDWECKMSESVRDIRVHYGGIVLVKMKS